MGERHYETIRTKANMVIDRLKYVVSLKLN